MRIDTRNTKRIQDLSKEFFLPATKASLEDFLEKSFTNFTCPTCGAEAHNGNKFNIFLKATLVASAAIIHAREKKSLEEPKPEWATSLQHIENLEVSAISCEECRYTNVPEAFSKETKENVRAKIVKIHDNWVSMISHGKAFYVSAALVPADLCDQQEVLVCGISFGEIDDKMKLDDPSISIKPLA